MRWVSSVWVSGIFASYIQNPIHNYTGCSDAKKYIIAIPTL